MQKNFDLSNWTIKAIGLIFRKYFDTSFVYKPEKSILLSIRSLNSSDLDSVNDGTDDGEAVEVNDLYFIRDNNSTLYWTSFEHNELQQTNEFTKSARIGKKKNNLRLYWLLMIIKFQFFVNFPVQQSGNKLHFEDDTHHYEIILTDAKMHRYRYAHMWVFYNLMWSQNVTFTLEYFRWNVKNVCFTRTNAANKTFQFVWVDMRLRHIYISRLCEFICVIVSFLSLFFIEFHRITLRKNSRVKLTLKMTRIHLCNNWH